MNEEKRREFVDAISKYIRIALKNNRFMDEISIQLNRKHNITLGRIMYFFNDTERLMEENIAEVALIAEQLYLKLDEAEELNLNLWFTPVEIKRFRQFNHKTEYSSDKLELPITFQNADYLGNGVYQVAVELTMIGRMYKHGILNYNFNIQREGTLKRVAGEIVKDIKVYRKNVREIKQEAIMNELDKTALAYNCQLDTSDDDSEQEILYDPESHTLEITKGTIIDILDGTHRTMGIYEAYLENPNLEGKITVLFSNYTEERAKKYQVSLAKATPFNKTRAKELAKLTLSDDLVSRLKNQGALSGKIASNNRPNRNFNQLTSTEVLSNAFERHWKPEKRSEIKDIIRNFNEYLEYLFDYYDEYVKDEDNLLFSMTFFIGHVILAKKMLDNSIPYENLDSILENIDFNIHNEMWKEKNIVGEDNRILYNKRTVKAVEHYFKTLEVKLKWKI